MSVQNGQVADENTFNGGFISRNSDSNTIGKLDLKETSSTEVLDLQGTINGMKAIDTDHETRIGDNETSITNLDLEMLAHEHDGVLDTKVKATNLDAEASTLGQVLASNGDGTTSFIDLTGGLSFQGTWDADTNTPDLIAFVKDNGFYWIVSVAGSTNLDGITDWQIGDWAIYNGTAFQKIDNTSVVTSVNGQVGTVVLDADDIAESVTRKWDIKNNRSAVVDPIVTDDDSAEYTIGSTWFNSLSGVLFVCQDASTGAAIWIVASGSGGSSDVLEYENFEINKPTDIFTATGGLTVVDDESTEIEGDRSLKITQSTASLNDTVSGDAILVTEEMKVYGTLAREFITSFNSLSGDYTYKMTYNNGSIDQDLIQAVSIAADGKSYRLLFNVPDDAVSFKDVFTLVNPNDLDELIIDKLGFKVNPLATVESVESESLIYSVDQNTFQTTSGDIRFPVGFDNSLLEHTRLFEIQDVGSVTRFVATSSIVMDFSITNNMSGATIISLKKNGVRALRGTDAYSNTAFALVSGSFDLKRGDYITVESTMNNAATLMYLSIIATASSNNVVFEGATETGETENVFSARISNDGATAVIVSQSIPFITGVNRDSQGVITVTFTAGFFTDAPSLVGISDNGGRTVTFDSVSTTSAVVRNESSVGVSDDDIMITIQRQGTDYVNKSDLIYSVPVTNEVENDFTATIANNGTANITSQRGNFIQSVNRDSLGIITVTFVTGFFTALPDITFGVKVDITGNPRQVGYTSLTTSTMVVETALYTSAFQDFEFTIFASRSGADYKAPRGYFLGTMPRTSHVTGGTEYKTADTWDGKPIYARSYVTSGNITSAVTIDTIDTGLTLIDSYKESANVWLVSTQSYNASNVLKTSYNDSTGVLTTEGLGATLFSGSTIIVKYTKP